MLNLMRGKSADETLQDKESYELLEAPHGARVCAYRVYKGRFTYPLFN